ncbi:NAD(P)-dependent oxidoreductase [Rathayibacter sp. VKM Ac-2929]|uniref:NAD(P)-dependent oxidoreductase n=1 Tax=Rathayibacter sp. VKM Ac-2929 TaxID=2929480 RepID=UPI001FB20171|nr:NAD(P)-dependent oxidoreductase [Rathayibacter sp. VKM Ac-2929]MCJ1673359.1 NAD(P)-dependent oxidoreductase [Rathayibacter sp. VKM Ac-2929]
MKISLLGVGRMGRELAVHLLTDGHELTVWNRTPGGADRIVAAGAARADDLVGAVEGADVVMTVLFGPDTVREVVTAADLPIPAEAVWLDVTTVAPADADEFQAWADARGTRYVHSPVVGTLAPARAGTLGVLVGGAEADVERVLPLVRLWSDPERIRVTGSAAKAAVGKLIANLAIAVSLQGLVESFRLGRANGVDAEEVLAMLDKTGLGFMAGMKGPMILADGFADTQFSADLLAKDSRLMLHSSPDPLPAVTAMLETLTRVQRDGDGDSDIAVVVRAELS